MIKAGPLTPCRVTALSASATSQACPSQAANVVLLHATTINSHRAAGVAQRSEQPLYKGLTRVRVPASAPLCRCLYGPSVHSIFRAFGCQRTNSISRVVFEIVLPLVSRQSGIGKKDFPDSSGVFDGDGLPFTKLARVVVQLG